MFYCLLKCSSIMIHLDKTSKNGVIYVILFNIVYTFIEVPKTLKNCSTVFNGISIKYEICDIRVCGTLVITRATRNCCNFIANYAQEKNRFCDVFCYFNVNLWLRYNTHSWRK